MTLRKRTGASAKASKKAGAAPRARSTGGRRARPGTKGGGRYYRIEIRPGREFADFRYHDVGRRGHAVRLAGKRASGRWADAAWLIAKGDAHIEKGKLVGDTAQARRILTAIGPARHVRGDIFRGHPRRNVPEKAKPTAAQRRARAANIRKAQAARRSAPR